VVHKQKHLFDCEASLFSSFVSCCDRRQSDLQEGRSPPMLKMKAKYLGSVPVKVSEGQEVAEAAFSRVDGVSLFLGKGFVIFVVLFTPSLHRLHRISTACAACTVFARERTVHAPYTHRARNVHALFTHRARTVFAAAPCLQLHLFCSCTVFAAAPFLRAATETFSGARWRSSARK
jgi:hypothetical protein